MALYETSRLACCCPLTSNVEMASVKPANGRLADEEEDRFLLRFEDDMVVASSSVRHEGIMSGFARGSMVLRTSSRRAPRRMRMVDFPTVCILSLVLQRNAVPVKVEPSVATTKAAAAAAATAPVVVAAAKPKPAPPVAATAARGVAVPPARPAAAASAAAATVAKTATAAAANTTKAARRPVAAAATAKHPALAAPPPPAAGGLRGGGGSSKSKNVAAGLAVVGSDAGLLVVGVAAFIQTN